MPRVDFYVLDTTAPAAREAFGCRLIEKAWQQGHRVFVRTPDAASTARVDDLLWTFRKGSFVPHAATADAAGEPVLVGERTPADMPTDVLVNLGEDLPADWERFSRVAEIVIGADGVRAGARARFRAYREAGAEPATHTMAG